MSPYGILSIEVVNMYEKIRHFREDKDYTQNDIAKYLQIHQTTYSDYELGNLNIPVSVLVKLAELYETSIDYLAALTDDPRPYPRKKKVKKMKIPPITVRIHPAKLAVIDKIASKKNISRSAYINQCIDAALGSTQKPKNK